jgi:hypothetical protein
MAAPTAPCRTSVVTIRKVNMTRRSDHQEGQHDPTHVGKHLLLAESRGAASPPRDPNDDEDEEDEEDGGDDGDDREPAVIREPDED